MPDGRRLGYVYATRLLPETKGRTLEEIERSLRPTPAVEP